jgi:hypothetical protein
MMAERIPESGLQKAMFDKGEGAGDFSHPLGAD